MILRFVSLLALVACGNVLSSAQICWSLDKPNILLLMVDDLKPALGCYGDPQAITPHMDRLASRGMRFELAYCNQAVCAPSRFSLMLGSHSSSTGLYNLGSQLRQIIPDAVTLPQHFALHGYRTESLGKVFHVGHGNQGDPQSFSVDHFHDKVIEYVDATNVAKAPLTREEAFFSNKQLGNIGSLPRGAVLESPVVMDQAYADGRVAEETVRRLQAAKQRRLRDGVPFFIATGFARPHLPFSVPRKYWDLHDPDQLPMPQRGQPPQAAPASAGKTNSELANYDPVPASGVPDPTLSRQLIHGYYASTSFVDSQIGKVLDALAQLELEDNTIVVLWGDHGFHLGDHGYWTKHTNYEQANRIPIVIVAPGVTPAGSVTHQLTESVDIFPTLADLAGLPLPKGPQPIDGINLAPVLRDPSVRLRDHAYHVFPRTKLGRAIRTERYRFVEWKHTDLPDQSVEHELYDYQIDPEESRNLADTLPEIVKQLSRQLAQYPAPLSTNPKSSSRPK